MQVLQAIFLGLVQGLTEFIPVSSSGHLILAEKLFNLEVGSLLFDVTLHFGTLLALLIYFRSDIAAIIRQTLRPKGSRLAWLIVVGTIPAVIAGYFLQGLAESTFRSIYIVVFNLMAVAIIMLLIDRTERKRGLASMKPAEALGIGVSQALALVPGVSRSGITIVTGRIFGFSREVAARFAFLLAIPITAGAIVKLMLDGGVANATTNMSVFIAGTLASGFSGYIAIDFLIKYLQKHGLAAFAYYRIGLAATVLFVTLLR